MDTDEDFQFLHPLDLITKDVDELRKIIKEKKENIQKDKSKGKEKEKEKENIENGREHDRGLAMEKDKELAREKENEKQQREKEKERDRERTEKEKEKAKGKEKEKPFEDVSDVNHNGDEINGRLEDNGTDGGKMNFSLVYASVLI